jgi:hypothetical protein
MPVSSLVRCEGLETPFFPGVPPEGQRSSPLAADVDDLKEGKGASYVDASSHVLVLCSRGYFNSPSIHATAQTLDSQVGADLVV